MISEVLRTLLIAFGLFSWLFSFSFRIGARRWIPAAVVPVSLIGATAVFTVLHFSLNTLTLFGMVLAVGLMADDAVIVVEAAQWHIDEERVDSKEAARRAMLGVLLPVCSRSWSGLINGAGKRPREARGNE
jgi:multidrug efflux pump subunit AcrB